MEEKVQVDSAALPVVLDIDGDGFTLAEGDCDDENPVVHPMGLDEDIDGIDQNCDEANDYDQDEDSEVAKAYGGVDCNDTNSDINSSATEIWYDGIDQNCDQANDFDQDSDGQEADWAPEDADC